jgi:hypothetical protein
VVSMPEADGVSVCVLSDCYLIYILPSRKVTDSYITKLSHTINEEITARRITIVFAIGTLDLLNNVLICLSSCTRFVKCVL